MKKIAFALIITLFAYIYFSMPDNKNDYPISKGEQLVNRTLVKGAKIIYEKYDLKPCGEGAAMPGGPIQGLTLCFNTTSPLSKEQLRELLIKSAQEVVQLVQEDNEIQEFLKDPPFHIGNVQIVIFNRDKNRREVFDPGISTAQISQETLSYATIDKSDTFKYKNEFEETYEEALKALAKP